MIPGRTLHRLAARLCSPKSLARIVEPAIADLQREYLDAVAQPPLRRSCVLLAAYFAVLKVMAFTMVHPTVFSPEDRRVLSRTLAVAGVVIVALSALLIAFPMAWFPQFIEARHVVFLIPQALPLSIPLGVMLGIAYGFAGRDVSGRAVKIAIVLALICSILSLGTMLWMMPAANQAFRQEIFTALGNQGTAWKGSSEMSLAELREEIADANAHWDQRRVQDHAWSYYLRWALPWATLVLTLFAFATRGRLPSLRRWMVMATCVIYFMLLHLGEALVYRWSAPAFLGPWLPNVAFVLAAIALRLRPTEARLSAGLGRSG
jgi:hypothetical protein